MNITFSNQLGPVAPPPPAPPSVPYGTKELPFGTNRTRLAKVYADGRDGEFLTDDEIAMLAVVQHREGVLSGEIEPTVPEPKSPYVAKPFEYGGYGVMRTYFAKVFLDDARKYNDPTMSDEELQVWQYAEVLRDQIAAKAAEVRPTTASKK
ncbi:MAG: hypothetical protein U0792_00660 [Gemmataceae bacterium]